MTDNTDRVVSKTSKKDQCRLLELLADSISSPKISQYQFTHALNEFVKLSPEDKLQEIEVWIKTMQNILYGKNDKL